MGSPEIGKCHIFFNGHIGSGAPEGILEKSADHLAALVVRLGRDVLPIQNDRAGIRSERPGNGPKQGGFSGAVGAKNRYKIPGGKVGVKILGAVLGSVIYRFIIALALRLDLPSECLKLISAVIVALAIGLPAVRSEKKGAKKC